MKASLTSTSTSILDEAVAVAVAVAAPSASVQQQQQQQQQQPPRTMRSKKHRNEKKASRTSHSSTDVSVSTATTTTTQPGASYKATVAASHRLKEQRHTRTPRTPSPSTMANNGTQKTGRSNDINSNNESVLDQTAGRTSRAAATATATTKGGNTSTSLLHNNTRSKNKETDLLQMASTQPSASMTSSTVVPGPTFLERQQNRQLIQPGAQAIPGSHRPLNATDDEQADYNFTPAPAPAPAQPHDALSLPWTTTTNTTTMTSTFDGDTILTQAERVEDPIYALEAVDFEHEKEMERKRRCRYAIWGFLGATVAAVAITLITIFVTRPAPVPAPTLPPTFADESAIADFLLTLSDGNDDVTEDATSPQGRAFNWILSENEQQQQNDSDSDSIIILSLTKLQLQQRYAMAVLYFATEGDTGAWQTNRNWLSSQHSICEWTQSGTNVCNEEDGLLREFTMDRNNMQGTLPTEIAHFKDSLQVLDVTLNKIAGTLPTELGTMTLLETLHLSLNQMTGTVPTELGQLTNVRQLYVDGNLFGETMPTQICDLKSEPPFALEKLWADCAIVTTTTDEGGINSTTSTTGDIECNCCKCCPGTVPCNEA